MTIASHEDRYKQYSINTGMYYLLLVTRVDFKLSEVGKIQILCGYLDYFCVD